MKQKLRDYFFDRLSVKDEESVQKYICDAAEDLDGELRSLFDECLKYPSPRSRRHVSIPLLLTGAVAVCAVLLLFILVPASYNRGHIKGEERISSIEWLEVNVPFGEDRTLTLCDGTVLHLNSGSRLTYPREFTGSNRTVFMNGEAFLNVAKDADHPFVIKSQDIDVKVLGTSFNFRNYSGERHAELLLLDGKVEAKVTLPNDTKLINLAPGDKVKYDRTKGKIDIDRFSVERYKTFYQNNSLHFFDIEMSDIAAELSRRFNCQIVVADRKLASRRYFSIFTNNETLDEVLSAMNSDGSMIISRSGGIIYLRSN